MKKVLVKHEDDRVTLTLLEDDDNYRHNLIDVFRELKCSFMLINKGMTFVIDNAAYCCLIEYIYPEWETYN